MGSTPWDVVTAVAPPRLVVERELVAVTRGLERAALADPPPVVGACLQDVRFLSARTRSVYARLAAAGSRAVLFARDLQSWLAPGVEGVALDEDDPLARQWVFVSLSPRDPVALAAVDVAAPEDDDVPRLLSYALSRDPEVVRTCAGALGLGVRVDAEGR